MIGIAIHSHKDLSLAFGGRVNYASSPTNSSAGSPNSIYALKFETGIQSGVGGDMSASFTIALKLYNSLPFSIGNLVFIYSSDVVLWAGRVTETQRNWSDSGFNVNVMAKGLWIALTERLLSEALSNPTTEPNITEAIGYVLRELELRNLIAVDLTYVDDFTTGLGVDQWTAAQYSQYLSEIAQRFVGFGNDDTPPLPLYLTISGWQNNYLGMRGKSYFNVSLEPPWLTSEVAGAGVVDYDTSVAGTSMCNFSGALADAAMIHDNTKIEKDTYQRDRVVRYLTRGVARNVGATQYAMYFGIITKTTAPVVEATAAFDARIILRVYYNPVAGGVVIEYRDDAGNIFTWNGAAWAAGTAVAHATGIAAVFQVVYEHNDTGWVVSLFNTNGTTLLTQTTMVPWTTWVTKDTNSLWALYGCPYNDAWACRYDAYFFVSHRMTSGALPRLRAADLTDFEYETTVEEVGRYTISDPDESLANSIVASYGDPVGYTAIAQDTDSIDSYGTRQLLVQAGDNVTGTAALRMRDLKLENSKDGKWNSGTITLRGGVKRKGGGKVPPWSIKSGDRLRISNALFPDGLTFVVGRTEYNSSDNSVSISPYGMPDSVDFWINQLAASQ
jgi:hypothetical protein